MTPSRPTQAAEVASPGSHEGTRVSKSSSSPRTSVTPVPEKDKPRLTEQEKKSNHIASEQKRRAAIREGFDRLTELVPGLAGQGRSEGMVLRKTVDYIQQQMQERRELIDEIERRGGKVDDRLRNMIEPA